MQRVCCSGAEPIWSFCEGARAVHMRAALANSREVLGGESFEHDREGHRGEKLLEVASEWRRRARPKSLALTGTWTSVCWAVFLTPVVASVVLTFTHIFPHTGEFICFRTARCAPSWVFTLHRGCSHHPHNVSAHALSSHRGIGILAQSPRRDQRAGGRRTRRTPPNTPTNRPRSWPGLPACPPFPS